MNTDIKSVLPLRTWCYLQNPSVFCISACSCGNINTVWSEFEQHIWCPECEIDFIPTHAGIFDGPIPVKAAALMGISFDRIILDTHIVERFDLETSEYIRCEDN